MYQPSFSNFTQKNTTNTVEKQRSSRSTCTCVRIGYVHTYGRTIYLSRARVCLHQTKTHHHHQQQHDSFAPPPPPHSPMMMMMMSDDDADGGANTHTFKTRTCPRLGRQAQPTPPCASRFRVVGSALRPTHPRTRPIDGLQIHPTHARTHAHTHTHARTHARTRGISASCARRARTWWVSGCAWSRL